MTDASRTFRQFLSLLLAAQICGAQALPNKPGREWSNLSKLSPGRWLTIETDHSKSKVKGAFVSADDAGLTVQLGSGQSQTIARDTISRVTASRKLRTAALIGAAAGAATIGGVGAAKGDLSGAGVAAMVAGGAAFGALMGCIVEAARGPVVIYEAPSK